MAQAIFVFQAFWPNKYETLLKVVTVNDNLDALSKINIAELN